MRGARGLLGGITSARRLAAGGALALALTLLHAGGAYASDPGYSWQSGPLVETQVYDCIDGELEAEAGSFMSYYVDPASPPQTGQTYYVAINVTGIGDPCPGMYADVELGLPSGTSLAIDATHPVECFLEFPGASSFQRDTQDCPSSLGAGIDAGYYSLDPITNPYFWPLPAGGTVEVNVPVKSSTAGVSQISGAVQIIDGGADPIMTPYIDAIVDATTQAPSSGNGNVNSEVSISYPDPSITLQSQPTTNGPVALDATGYVWNNSASGSVYAEITLPSTPHGTAAANCNSPYNLNGTASSATYYYPFKTPTVSLKSPDTEVYGDPDTFTGLYPGTPYCWRLVATVTSPSAAAGTYYGSWQFFDTIGSVISGAPYAASNLLPLSSTSSCTVSGGSCSSSSCAGTNSCSTCTTNCLSAYSPSQVKTPTATATPTPAPSPIAPTVTSLGQSHAKWKLGGALAQISKVKHKKGTGPPVGDTFTMTLNEAASVSMVFTRHASGRSVGGKCVAETKANKRKKACALAVNAGTLTFSGHAGVNTVVFEGRVSASEKLKPGSYSVGITATSSALVSPTGSLSFKIAQ